MRKTPRTTPGRVIVGRAETLRHGGRAGAELLWAGVLLAVPLVVGVAVDVAVSWWAGFAAFMIAAMLTGVGAYRSGRPGSRR